MKIRRRIASLIGICTLGLLFTIPQAIGLGTPAIDLGNNPIFSLSGSGYASNSGFTNAVITAPANQDMRITDLQISVCCDSNAYGASVSLSTASGTLLGTWNINRNNMLLTSMESGIVVPAGEELIISGSRNNSSVNVRYTLAGQYIRP